MLNQAYAVIAKEPSLNPELKIGILLELSTAVKDLIEGQGKDLGLCKEKKITLDTLNKINTGKTPKRQLKLSKKALKNWGICVLSVKN